MSSKTLTKKLTALDLYNIGGCHDAREIAHWQKAVGAESLDNVLKLLLRHLQPLSSLLGLVSSEFQVHIRHLFHHAALLLGAVGFGEQGRCEVCTKDVFGDRELGNC